MASFVDNLKKALDSFRSVKTDIAEIRKCKAEVQSLKEELAASVKSGNYFRDDSRIIISSPEIIIGNVDHSGNLMDSGSTVVIRGNSVELQGSGNPDAGGAVITRAADIRQIAVDPGKDGLENVLIPGRSSILSKASSISIDSEDSSGVLVNMTPSGVAGVSITSDTNISLDAAPSNKLRQEEIDASMKGIDDLSKTVKTEVDRLKSFLDDLLEYLSKQAGNAEGFNDTENKLRTNYRKLLDMREDFINQESGLCSTLESYVAALSRKAELDREKDALKKMKDELSKKSADFSKKTTGSSVTVNSESFSFSSIDGDGNVRENAEAGFFIGAPHVSITANDAKGALIKESDMKVNVQKFELSTANSKYEDEKLTKGTFAAEGDVTVISKNVTFQSIDTELKDKKITERALTKGGTFSIRSEKVSLQATDTEGKSTGEIRLNAKNIQMASMDVDKEKRTDKEMAAGSRMVLLSEKMFTGSLDKKNKSKLVQVVSDKVGIMADTTAEMQQGEAKAVVTLEGGNLAAGGGKNEFSGDTVISGKADIKGDVEAPNGKFKGVEASGKFTSASISDGMMGGTPAAPGKPSAKMKLEEVPKEENK